MHRWCPRARPWVQWKVRESWMMVSDIYNSTMKLVEGVSDIYNSTMVEGVEGFQMDTLLYHGGGGALVKVG